MNIYQVLELNISNLASCSEDINKYGQYRYLFGVIETLLMLGEIDLEQFQEYSKQIRSNIDVIPIMEKLKNPILQNDCMIDQTWFMKGTPVANLIHHAEGVYKAEAIAQNSKIKFGTDDKKTWWAHDVPFFDTVQLDQIEEHGLIEWDIYFNECWQGPFNSKSKAIQHLEECIQEMREEQGLEG